MDPRDMQQLHHHHQQQGHHQHQHQQQQHQQHQQHHQQQQQQANMMMAPNMYRNSNAMINPNSMANIPPSSNSNSSSGVRLPFNNLVQTPPPQQPQPQQPPQQPYPGQQQHQSSKPSLDSFSNAGFEGSPSQSSMRFNLETAKKKRGRPRKYTPDGNIALGLSPATPAPSASASANHGDSYAVSAASGGTTPTGSEPNVKRNRGRPPGSGKKQLDALGGTGGVGFTPHVISVEPGEDIASKIMAFSQQGPRTVCILSANGAVSHVILRQPAMSGGTVSYEGRYEIISLSGSFLLTEENGNRSRTGGLSVSLAGTDGRVMGGGVAGMLKAATVVQVIVGSFIADAKKLKSNALNSGPSPTQTSQMMNFGAPVTAASPPSHGVSSESSDEDGSSPLNQGPGMYNDSGSSLPGMPRYQLWAGQAQQ